MKDPKGETQMYPAQWPGTSEQKSIDKLKEIAADVDASWTKMNEVACLDHIAEVLRNGSFGSKTSVDWESLPGPTAAAMHILGAAKGYKHEESLRFIKNGFRFFTYPYEPGDYVFTQWPELTVSLTAILTGGAPSPTD